MTPKAAAWISRGLIALAGVMVVATWALGAMATSITSPIVVGDVTVADGAQVYQRIQELTAAGTLSHPVTLSAGTVMAALLLLLWTVTGSVIVSRQPKNLAGWLFITMGLAWAVGGMGVGLTLWATTRGIAGPGVDAAALLGNNSLLPIMLMPLLFLLFPDGRAPARWRWVVWAMFTALVLVILGYVLGPGPLNNLTDAGVLYVNPIGIGSKVSADALAAIGTILALASGLATVPAVRGRYKRATGETRQQLRWLVTVATVAGLMILLAIVVTILFSNSDYEAPIFPILLVLLVLVITVGVPAAYLVAIFRYGLWDLDIVIKKAVLYFVVAALVLVTFGLVLLLFGQLFVNSDRALAVAAGIAGLLAWPAVRLARRLADRIVYRGRATPYEALASFGQRMSETYSTEDVLDRTAQLLASATGAERAVVWLRIGREMRPAASAPAGALAPPIALVGDELPSFEADAAEPVRDQGELLGALAIDMPANDPLDPGRERILRDLAAQAGLALRNVRLIEELRASRQRLVAAQDEERRKLERNIHDGVQQQLVALAVRLKLADTMIDRDAAKAHEALAALQTDAGTTLDDLRDLARGIYPPLLADKGLVSALEAQARKAAVPTQVETDGVERYPRDVESTVYFCTLEALNNIAKYAAATTATITLTQDNGHVRFRVSDDGDGFDPTVTSYGTGLQGMADRLDAIGGSLDVTSSPGSGTTVTGRVPVS